MFSKHLQTNQNKMTILKLTTTANVEGTETRVIEIKEEIYKQSGAWKNLVEDCEGEDAEFELLEKNEQICIPNVIDYILEYFDHYKHETFMDSGYPNAKDPKDNRPSNNHVNNMTVISKFISDYDGKNNKEELLNYHEPSIPWFHLEVTDAWDIEFFKKFTWEELIFAYILSDFLDSEILLQKIAKIIIKGDTKDVTGGIDAVDDEEKIIDMLYARALAHEPYTDADFPELAEQEAITTE